MEWTRSTPLQFATEVLLLLYQESLFTVRTVDELLWGYRDRLLSTIHLLHPEIDPVFGLFNKVTAVQDVLVLYKGMATVQKQQSGDKLMDLSADEWNRRWRICLLERGNGLPELHKDRGMERKRVSGLCQTLPLLAFRTNVSIVYIKKGHFILRMVEALSSCGIRAAPSVWGVSNTYRRCMTAVWDQETEDNYLEHLSPMKQNICR